MDFSDQLRSADKMLLNGYTGQAVVAAGQIPRASSPTTLPVGTAPSQSNTKLAIGQPFGLFREAALLDEYEEALTCSLPLPATP